MKHAVALLTAVLSLAAARAWEPQQALVSIAAMPPDADRLQSLGLVVTDAGSGAVRGLATAAALGRLRAAGWAVTIELDDYAAHDPCDDSGLPGFYHTYAQVRDTLAALALRHPDICRLETLGLSVQGRLLLALCVSDNIAISEAEPRTRLDGNIHGNEKIGCEMVMHFARVVCDSYGLSPRLTALVNAQELTLIPMVNPDGAVANVRTNASGVDLNRDFGYMWDAWGASPDWCSQPETRALRDDCARQDYCLSFTYHSGAVCVIYPWMYTPVPTADDPLYKRLVWAYHSATGYDTIRSYRWYQTRGQSMDDRYGLDGTLEASAELHQSNPPPESIIHRCRANFEATLYFLEKAATGIHGRVLDAETGEPVHALIRLGPLWGGRDWFVYSARANGDFHRPLLAGDYTLAAWAPGYAETTLAVNLPDTVAPVTVELSLRPQPSGAAFRLVAVQQNDTVGLIAPSLTHSVLGEPDARAWSMSRRGRLILDLGRPVVDAPGPDFAVFEYPDTTDTVLVSVARHWTGPWTSLGLAIGTCSLDLAGRGVDSVRYILVRDVSRRPNSGPADGYDLDAVVCLNPPTAVAGRGPLNSTRNTHNATVIRSVLRLPAYGVEREASSVLLDASGRRVISLRPGPNDVSRLVTGVYFVVTPAGPARVAILR